jgi:hypothetical protein
MKKTYGGPGLQSSAKTRIRNRLMNSPCSFFLEESKGIIRTVGLRVLILRYGSFCRGPVSPTPPCAGTG